VLLVLAVAGPSRPAWQELVRLFHRPWREIGPLDRPSLQAFELGWAGRGPAPLPEPVVSEPVEISFEEVPAYIRAMHLLVTEVAVQESRAAEVMQPRRNGTKGSVHGRLWSRKVGVALQAHEADLRPGEHARVGRAVRLMAGHTTFEPHGGMLVSERPSLVAMALEAAGFVGVGGLDGPRQEAAVWIVAIHAGHGALRHPMLEWLLKAGPHIRMARGAQLVDIGGLAGDQPVGPVLVDGVALDAAHLVLGVAAIQSAYVGGLIQMAGEAGLVGFSRLELRGIADVRG
jgi:hypothetical protein